MSIELVHIGFGNILAMNRAIAIASPDEVTLPVMAATGVLFGGFLLLLAFTGLIDQLSKLFTKPIIRGIQLGLGLVLITKGIDFIQKKELFIQNSGNEVLIGSVLVNIIILAFLFFGNNFGWLPPFGS